MRQTPPWWVRKPRFEPDNNPPVPRWNTQVYVTSPNLAGVLWTLASGIMSGVTCVAVSPGREHLGLLNHTYYASALCK